MRNPGRTLSWLVTALATTSPALAGNGAAATQTLFHFAKSDSSNEVHYAAQTSEDCELAPEPVHTYWIRRTDRLEYRRELNWAEKNSPTGSPSNSYKVAQSSSPSLATPPGPSGSNWPERIPGAAPRPG